MKNNIFAAIDFEHATSAKGSICSVGIAIFEDGNVIDTFYSLVRPPNNEYSIYTIKKHKITPEQTINSLRFDEVFPEIKRRLIGKKVIAHGAFHTDKHCLEQAMAFYDIQDQMYLNWECTQNIVEVALHIACKECDIMLEHHHALSDAIACGQLYNLYLNGKLDFEKIRAASASQKKKKKPEYQKKYPARINSDLLQPDFENAVNKTTIFFKKKVVITGFADSLKNEIATDLKNFGADIDESVGKQTNFLIIGESPGPSKLKKMQINIDEGRDAQILNYFELVLLLK